MPGRCSAPRCTNSNKEGFCLTTFTQDSKLRQEWIDAAGIPDWNPPKSAVLCEVHFRPSALYCVGNKKFIKKNIIPSFFCKCDGSIKRKPLAEIQSKELQCNELVESLPHKKVFSRNNFPSKFEQENKSSEEGQCVNEFKEHNYFSVRKNTECTTFQSYKKRRTERYVHTSDCIIKKKPITVDTLKKAVSEKENSRSDSDAVEDINTSPEIIRNEILSTESSPSLEDSTLKKALSEKENSRSDSDAVEDINTSPEIIRNKILSTESLPSPEDFKLLQEKLKMAEKEKDALRSTVNYLEKEVEKSTYIINKVLNKDQQEAILKGTTRGSKWSNETIKKGLKLHFACGSHGYKQIIELVAPFPASRTLREKIEHIKFQPGILEDIFKYLELIVPLIPPRWKICGLVFDEMAIKTQLEFDTSTGMYIGNVTLPGNTEKLACKSLVFQLFGLGFHWKQYVAYHFTPPSSMNDAVKEVIIEILQKCHHIGLKVIILVCDMGNRGLLTKMGFKTTKADMVYAVPHPCDPAVTLQLIPDPVHVFKNLKEMAMESQFIYLPQDVIELYNLPSNVVDMGHVEWLESYQSENYKEIKLAPKLNKAVLRPSHFNGMKVSNSTSVINYSTANALTFLVQEGDGIPEMETTAWFIRLIKKWFDIMTGRNLYHALSFHNPQEYNNAIEHLKLVCHIFKNMKVGCGSWKPSQTHVILTTESMIQLQDRLLNEEEFVFFFPGRASQDSLESGFANVRRGCSKPTALQFKSRLRQMCVAGGDRAISTSSYTYDEAPSLVTVLLTKLNENEKEETIETHCNFPKLSDCEPMSENVKKIFYRMCGYVVFKLRASIKCENCYLKLQDNSDFTYTPSSLSAFVAISDYTPGAQIKVSTEVFNILEGTERIIWKSKSRLLLLGKSLNNKFISHFNTALKHLPLSTCHDIKQKLISRFVSMRLKQLSVPLSITEDSEKISSAFASKTMGAGLLADRFKQKKYARRY